VQSTSSSPPRGHCAPSVSPCLSCLEQIEPDAAATIANAVSNATGKRVRGLPITLDKLL